MTITKGVDAKETVEPPPRLRGGVSGYWVALVAAVSPHRGRRFYYVRSSRHDCLRGKSFELLRTSTVADILTT